MLMSWNFSQCFYYRPPVLNIFQSNTPKFHCLQWINNTVLSLKYHAFFNQAPGLKQRLLERYFFMIRTIRNLAALPAIVKGCSQPERYACVCVCECIRPPRVDSSPFLQLVSELSVFWVDHISHGWWLKKTKAMGFVNCENKRSETHKMLCCMIWRCSPSCKINIPKFSTPVLPPTRIQPSNSVLLLRTRHKFVLVVCGVWSPLCWTV